MRYLAKGSLVTFHFKGEYGSLLFYRNVLVISRRFNEELTSNAIDLARYDSIEFPNDQASCKSYKVVLDTEKFEIIEAEAINGERSQIRDYFFK